MRTTIRARRALALPLTLAIALAVGVTGASAAAPRVTEFTVPTSGGVPTEIAAGPDGSMWFTEEVGNQLGRITPGGEITELALPHEDTLPFSITTGPDGNLWFTEDLNGNGPGIGRMTPTGRVTEFAVPTGACNGRTAGEIATGPDGNLWFAAYGTDKIDRITTGGALTEFPLPTPDACPLGITPGPDGNVWFTEYFANQIGRITPAGVVTEFPVPTAASAPDVITAGPDGNLWFTESAVDKIGRITTGGSITEFSGLTPGSFPAGIATGLDGNLWFTENFAGGRFGRITPAGTVTEYPLASPNSQPYGIAAGPDGNVWFAQGPDDEGISQIARVKTAKAGRRYVLALNSGFVPSTRSAAQGSTVQWGFYGASAASIEDRSGMDLFGSGSQLPVSYYAFGFTAAGTYLYGDGLVPSHSGAIAVPTTATPTAGDETTQFTITWASAPPPAGFVFDVQILRPTDSAFGKFLNGQSATSTTFVPDVGMGWYFFRARLHKTADGTHSHWSPPVEIAVS